MQPRRSFVRSLLAVASLSLVVWSPSVSAEVFTLTPGTVTGFQPEMAECVAEVLSNTGSVDPLLVDPDCDGERLTVLADSGSTTGSVSVTTSSRFVLQFRAEDATVGIPPRRIPVQIVVPVRWLGRTESTGFVGAPLPSTIGDVDMYLRITPGTDDDPADGGPPLEQLRFHGLASLAADSCVTAPGPRDVPAGDTAQDFVSATAQDCALDVFGTDRGAARPSVVALVETGRTYNVELDLRMALAWDDPPRVGASVEVNYDAAVPSGDPWGLFWEGAMEITLGTDDAPAIEDNFFAIQQNAADIRDNADAIARNAAAIAVNAGEIARNRDDIDQNSRDIEENADAIETNRDAIAANRADILQLQADVAMLRADLTRLRSDLEGHTHVYLTGRGEGHNNTTVSTGIADLPEGSPPDPNPPGAEDPPPTGGDDDRPSKPGKEKKPKDKKPKEKKAKKEKKPKEKKSKKGKEKKRL